MGDPSIPLTWPVFTGILAGLAMLVSNVVILTRRYDAWQKAEEHDKDLNGDPKATDQKLKDGIKDRLSDLEKTVELWAGKQRADLRGRGIPTDVSDLRELEILIKEKYKPKRTGGSGPLGLPPLPPPPRQVPRTPALPYSSTHHGETDDESDEGKEDDG